MLFRSLVVLLVEIQPRNVEEVDVKDDRGVGRDPGAPGGTRKAFGEGQVAWDVNAALPAHLQDRSRKQMRQAEHETRSSTKACVCLVHHHVCKSQFFAAVHDGPSDGNEGRPQ